MGTFRFSRNRFQHRAVPREKRNVPERPVAQLVEQRSPKPQVGGSRPSWPAIPATRELGAPRTPAKYSMETKVESEPTFADTAKLALAALIVLVGFAAYYYFGDASTLLRALAVLVAAGLAAFVGFQSAQGQTLWRFIQASRVELRKVVWPTREETIQTT